MLWNALPEIITTVLEFFSRWYIIYTFEFMDLMQKIKRMTISALLADEILLALLVLKGGNAIDIAYDLSNRGSVDIDFSMEHDFTDIEKERIRNQSSDLLNKEFSKEGLFVFDVRFRDRPQVVRDEVKSFWGGYLLDFKVIEKEKYDAAGGDHDIIRKLAINMGSATSSTRFEVDISKYEFVGDKRAKDLEGTIIYVYSPEMIAIEKARALCQQNFKYRDIVYSMTAKSRARDFYDFHNLVETFGIDLKKQDNVELFRLIFDAKKVPLSYLAELAEQKELHRQSWGSVLNTISQRENVKEFDFYFDYLTSKVAHLNQSPNG